MRDEVGARPPRAARQRAGQVALDPFAPESVAPSPEHARSSRRERVQAGGSRRLSLIPRGLSSARSAAAARLRWPAARWWQRERPSGDDAASAASRGALPRPPMAVSSTTSRWAENPSTKPTASPAPRSASRSASGSRAGLRAGRQERRERSERGEPRREPRPGVPRARCRRAPRESARRRPRRACPCPQRAEQAPRYWRP